jgi:hypothetical protein
MHRRAGGCLGLLCLVFLLTGCGAGPACVSSGPSGPATVSQGSVTIGTDHSVYTPSDTIVVSITNRLDQPIYLVSQYSASETCPLFLLTKVDHRQSIPMNPCFKTEAAPSVLSSSIPAGTSGGDQFDSSNLTVPLTDGTYQVYAHYVPYPPYGVHAVTAGHPGIGLVSPTFQVCTCDSC